jgi:hypothetical protein
MACSSGPGSGSGGSTSTSGTGGGMSGTGGGTSGTGGGTSGTGGGSSASVGGAGGGGGGSTGTGGAGGGSSSSASSSSAGTGGATSSSTGGGLIDECTNGTANCDPKATCNDLPVGFTCTCPAGTVDVNGNGTSCITAGQGCGQAITVSPASLPTTVTGNTTSATGQYGVAAGSCPGVAGALGGASNDITYSFTPTVSATYNFNLTGTGFDSALYVVTDCSSINTSCVGAVDLTCSGCVESLSVALTAGTTYFIVVDGSSNVANASGAYSLQIKQAKSFSNPLQVDVSALLVDDTVVNNGLGALDSVQTGIDGQSNGMPTQSVATALGGANGVGLPDNATFAADGNHPLVHLGWDNANNGPNSRIVLTNGSFTLPVPADTYTQLQVYAISSEGPSAMKFTLTYSDATTDVRNITFGDWYDDPAASGLFFLINGLDRIGPPPGQMYQPEHDPAMAGTNLNPDPAKTLVSVQAMHLASNGWFVFYGATGW